MGEALRVSDLMTSEVSALSANDQLTIADDVMRLGRIRHMPVVDDDGALIGIVSQRDLFRGALARALGYGQHAQNKVLGMLKVKEIMTNEVITTGPETSVTDAAALMSRHAIGCLVVTDGDRLCGILTESDFVRFVVKSQ